MILDTSALTAILRNEPDGGAYEDLILSSALNRISAGTVVEAEIVAVSRNALRDLEEILDLADAGVVPVDAAQARLAREGFKRFGKGRHPAGLNFGDCFAYALARAYDEPLLFKGDDFSKTDVKVASPPQPRR